MLKTSFAPTAIPIAALLFSMTTAAAQESLGSEIDSAAQAEPLAEPLAESTIERAEDLADEAERVAAAGISDEDLALRPVYDQQFVHPITAPNYSEDALITTDLRGTYINHQFPRNGNLNGGAARVYDAQGRYAIDDRMQVMISKLGAADVHLPGSEEAGATDVAFGFKYAVIQDEFKNMHVAVGAGYELGLGDKDTLGDDDEFRLFAAWTKGLDRLNLSASANVLFATGSESDNGDSDRLSAHLHADYRIDEIFSPVAELNYYKVLSDSDDAARVTPFSGADLASFGGNEDEDVLTLGLGGEFRARTNFKLRLAYETPLTSNEDIFGYRWTASAIWSH